MAGANNRALKGAGIPKATIKTLRVENGGRLSLKSAITLAGERGLAIGRAQEHLAKRDNKAAKRPEAQQAATDFRAKAAEAFKARAAATEKENRAAVLVHRLQAQARAYGPAQPKGQRAYQRAQAIAAKHPGAKPLADQIEKARWGRPEARSERIAGLLSRSDAHAEKSRQRREAAKAAARAAKSGSNVQQSHRLAKGSRLADGFVVTSASHGQITVHIPSGLPDGGGGRYLGRTYTFRWDGTGYKRQGQYLKRL
jgi:hypothetical protein